MNAENTCLPLSSISHVPPGRYNYSSTIVITPSGEVLIDNEVMTTSTITIVPKPRADHHSYDMIIAVITVLGIAFILLTKKRWQGGIL